MLAAEGASLLEIADVLGLLSAHRRGDFRVISARLGDGYSGALSSMSRCV
jgi:hypothetical protein